MSRVHGLLRSSPEIAISMLALIFAMGSGAGCAASTAASSSKPVFRSLSGVSFPIGSS
ncbi:MAG TPA: hypothetical protein VFQ44_07370 [Streptosporangiaceae bacterium]|nr:hypothetical protein [Streptosporangiaceae bacterium]